MPDYTLQYVYELSDFETTGGNITPPNEQGARAAGSPPFNITLSSGSSPIQITITDDDPNFQETNGADPQQLLTNAVTIDGVTYPAGSHVVLNYVLTDDNGFEGYSITIGSANSGSNTTTAFITNQPMVPGQQYVFTSEGNIGGGAGRPYAQFACFTNGSLIRTLAGLRRVEDLVPGDLVWTLSSGVQPLRWVGSRMVAGIGALTPIRIAKGTHGATRDHLISPNHRLYLQNAQIQLLLGVDAALVAAKSLVNGSTVTTQPCGFVTYIHLMFDRHEIVEVDGCLSESFCMGDGSRRALDVDQHDEIAHLFPELSSTGASMRLAAPEMRSYEAALLA